MPQEATNPGNIAQNAQPVNDKLIPFLAYSKINRVAKNFVPCVFEPLR